MTEVETKQKLRMHDHWIGVHGTPCESASYYDDLDRPAGGNASGTGWTISWQNGVVDPVDVPNGAMLEDVMMACIHRLEFYQGGDFACDENATALAGLRWGRDALLARRRDRSKRGVLGTHQR